MTSFRYCDILSIVSNIATVVVMTRKYCKNSSMAFILSESQNFIHHKNVNLVP